MSSKVKMLIIRIVMVVLFGTTLTFGGLFIKSQKQLATSQDQVTNLKELNESLNGFLENIGVDDYEDFVFITFIDIDGTETTYFVDKTLNLTIYDFLLTQNFDIDDFESYDGTNYYFKNALTDVLELKDNTDYYETSEWDGVIYTSLIVGLQAIVIDQDYTVVRSAF